MVVAVGFGCLAAGSPVDFQRAMTLQEPWERPEPPTWMDPR